jgi:hypothetical protein
MKIIFCLMRIDEESGNIDRIDRDGADEGLDYGANNGLMVVNPRV